YAPEALMLDERNINLLYQIAFANEMTGRLSEAESYYKRILNINPDNYEANYALGLLYLSNYLKDQKDDELLTDARYHLTRANEIDPYELKSLRSLSILHKFTGDKAELQKINNRINQLKLN